MDAWPLNTDGVTSKVRSARIVAHRGFSARQPEMTLAAYEEAIDWSLRTRVPLGLECDVRFSRDHHLVCLHDPSLSRTSTSSGLVEDQTLAELRALDFGSWKVVEPTVAQRSLVTLADLLALVAGARRRGADVVLSIETKHPNSQGLQVEARVCQMLAERGWNRSGSPVRLITFDVPAARFLAELVPRMQRTLLITGSLSEWGTGVLPSGIRDVGINIGLLRKHPEFVTRARRHGNQVHAWTVNRKADLEFCRAQGIAGVTTDDPDLAWTVLRGTEPATRLLGSSRFRRRWLAPSSAA